jgi:FPC/CPF motif-containing protein YcgG
MHEYNHDHRGIDTFVSLPSFPCTAAKSAKNRGTIREVLYGQLDEASKDMEILDDIERFISSFQDSGDLRSFVAAFKGPPGMSELEFEQAMWKRLQALHDLDAETCDWDRAVSCDPASPDFSFSLRGRAFFVIGLHPNASRASRRYSRPALVFNLHDQFETLRRQGRYDRMRDVIRRRDAACCGSINPALQDFGDWSEARQYSGRDVPDDWRCPFRPRRLPRRR